jgi:hypothetical protein
MYFIFLSKFTCNLFLPPINTYRMKPSTSAEKSGSADVVSVTAQIDFKTVMCRNISVKFKTFNCTSRAIMKNLKQSSGPVLRSHRVTGYTDRGVCASNVRDAINFMPSSRSCSTLHKKITLKIAEDHFSISGSFNSNCTSVSFEGYKTEMLSSVTMYTIYASRTVSKIYSG